MPVEMNSHWNYRHISELHMPIVGLWKR